MANFREYFSLLSLHPFLCKEFSLPKFSLFAKILSLLSSIVLEQSKDLGSVLFSVFFFNFPFYLVGAACTVKYLREVLYNNIYLVRNFEMLKVKNPKAAHQPFRVGIQFYFEFQILGRCFHEKFVYFLKIRLVI